jgi:hypothetical protein
MDASSNARYTYRRTPNLGVTKIGDAHLLNSS